MFFKKETNFSDVIFKTIEALYSLSEEFGVFLFHILIPSLSFSSFQGSSAEAYKKLRTDKEKKKNNKFFIMDWNLKIIYKDDA